MTNEFTIKRSAVHRALTRFFNGVLWLKWLMIPLALAGWATCAHFKCTAEEKTHEILERDGYENVETGNHAWLNCGKGDMFSNTFQATKNGKPVSGAVCCGIFKACTVRFE